MCVVRICAPIHMYSCLFILVCAGMCVCLYLFVCLYSMSVLVTYIFACIIYECLFRYKSMSGQYVGKYSSQTPKLKSNLKPQMIKK